MARSTQTLLLEFRRSEPVRDGITRLLETIGEAALQQAARPAAEHASAVHEMRRLLKRQRALVRLLRPTLGEEAARRENRRLQSAARLLAGARDAAVGLQTLEALAASAPRSVAPAVQAVRDRFAARVHPRHTRETVVARGLVRAATVSRASGRAIGRLTWKREGWKILEAGLREGYRRARRRFHKARLTSDETVFHAWRTATKSLMYQLALLQPARPARLRRLGAAIDEVQDRLGLEHDLSVLAARITAQRRAFGTTSEVESVLTLLANRQQAARKDCLRRGRKLFSPSTSAFLRALHADWKRWRAD